MIEISGVRKSIDAFTKNYNDMEKLLEILDVNTILSKTNFDALQTKLVEDSHVDKLNIVMMHYATLRSSIEPSIESCMSDMFYYNDLIVGDDIIKYDELTIPNKRLFELIVIINT